MKNKINKMVDKFCFCAWGITWYIATVCGVTILLENINFSKIGSSVMAGILFATFSFYYVMYKFERKNNKDI